jgi:hypothetical protein
METVIGFIAVYLVGTSRGLAGAAGEVTGRLLGQPPGQRPRAA